MSTIRKAITAGVSAVLTALAAAWIDGGAFPGWPAIVPAVVLGLGAAVAVWRVPNEPAAPAAIHRLQAVADRRRG
jgi:hypothetical protein